MHSPLLQGLQDLQAAQSARRRESVPVESLQPRHGVKGHIPLAMYPREEPARGFNQT